MKDISIYFNPVKSIDHNSSKSLGSLFHSHTEGDFPDLKKEGVAIFYVPEYRNSNYSNENANDSFRTSLYALYEGQNWNKTLYDLGTIQPGQTIQDTYFALSTVISELVMQNIIPIIVGGSQDLTFALYNGYKNLEQLVNITTIDSKIDLGDIESSIHDEGWISHILLQKPCYLFNFCTIGTQGHYVHPQELDLFENLYFDTLRLGSINEHIEVVEPQLRNTDILSFDLNTLRQSDLARKTHSFPNGIFANEACRIARYAGISDKLSSFGIFNYHQEDYPHEDETANEIVAQLIWYFIDGYNNRKHDYPVGSKKNYIKFRVFLEEQNEEVLFYKSNKSGRWWMEVPYPGKESKYQRHHLVPCSYEEYQSAMQGELPDLWWKTFQKLG